MAIKAKEKKILTFNKVCEIEKILGMDGVHEADGTFLLTHPSGRIIMISELETIFSKIGEQNGKKHKKTCRKCEKIT